MVLYVSIKQVLIPDSIMYYSVCAVTGGVVIGHIIVTSNHYIKKVRGVKLPILQHGTKRRFLRRILSRLARLGNKVYFELEKEPTGRRIIWVYEFLKENEVVNLLVRNSTRIIDGIIIARVLISTKNASLYYLRTNENLVKIAMNTLALIAYSDKRSKVATCAFYMVMGLTAKVWCSFPEFRAILKIWVWITLLNISGQIERDAHLPAAFGLPIVEHIVPRINYLPLSENRTNSSISMIGKENELNLSLPPVSKMEMTETISQNPELEITNIIQNSTLGPENTLLPKKEGLQKAKISRTNSTLKAKPRTNDLQNLNKTLENSTSSPLENDVENFYNITENRTEVKAEKVQ